MAPENTEHLHPMVVPEASGRSETSPALHADPDDHQLDLIAEAHTRVLDTVSGFKQVVEKAQPEFRPVAEAFLAMHVGHESELAAHLSSCSRDPGEDGSFFGVVNRTAVEIRSWFEDVTDSIMDRVAQGELHILDAYEKALEACQPGEAHALITRHIADIDAMMHKHKT